MGCVTSHFEINCRQRCLFRSQRVRCLALGASSRGSLALVVGALPTIPPKDPRLQSKPLAMPCGLI